MAPENSNMDGIKEFAAGEKTENLILFRMDEWQLGPELWNIVNKTKGKIVFTPWQEDYGEALIMPLSPFYDIPSGSYESGRPEISDKSAGLLKSELQFLERFFKVLGKR